jgi:hypothetical protein
MSALRPIYAPPFWTGSTFGLIAKAPPCRRPRVGRVLPMMICNLDILRLPVPGEEQPGRRRCLIVRVRQRSRLASTGGTNTRDSEYRQRQPA